MNKKARRRIGGGKAMRRLANGEGPARRLLQMIAPPPPVSGDDEEDDEQGDEEAGRCGRRRRERGLATATEELAAHNDGSLDEGCEVMVGLIPQSTDAFAVPQAFFSLPGMLKGDGMAVPDLVPIDPERQ